MEKEEYFARVDIGENGAPTAMTEAELDNGGSKENKLRSTRSHHFDKSVGRSVFI